MKTAILTAALSCTVLTLGGCGPKADPDNVATETLTLNEEGEPGTANSEAAAAATNAGVPASDDDAGVTSVNGFTPAEGNAF